MTDINFQRNAVNSTGAQFFFKDLARTAADENPQNQPASAVNPLDFSRSSAKSKSSNRSKKRRINKQAAD